MNSNVPLVYYLCIGSWWILSGIRHIHIFHFQARKKKSYVQYALQASLRVTTSNDYILAI